MKLSTRSWLLLAIAWFIIATILFCLPGKALPSASWMSTLQVDKWVHVGIFFLSFVLWRRALMIKTAKGKLLLALAAFAYGCLIEAMQHYFIPFRSFDLYDVVADTAGIIAAVIYEGYIKK